MNKRRREASSGSSDEPSSKAARNNATDQPETGSKKKIMYPVPLYLKRLISRLDDPEPLPEVGSADWKTLDRYVKLAKELGENRDGGPLQGLSPRAQTRLATLRLQVDRPRNFQPPIREVELLNPYENLQRQTSQPARTPKAGKSRLRSAITMESTTRPTKTILGTQNRSKGTTTRRSVSKGRNLRDITKIPTELFKSLVKKYSEGRLPTSLETQAAGESCDDPDKTNESLSLPCPGFYIPGDRIKPEVVKNENQIHNIVERLLLAASRILHVCNLDTRDWLFETPGGKGSRPLNSDIVWMKKDGDTREVDSRMVIEVKTPCKTLDRLVFLNDLRVFRGFNGNGGFSIFITGEGMVVASQLELHLTPNYSSLSNQLPNEDEVAQRYEDAEGATQDYNSVEQMWAQVYDYCHNRSNWFFVLTSYEYWIFGVFSLDWGSAFVTDPFPYDSTEPTTLEFLLYWTESAMFVPGLYEIPVVSSDPKLGTENVCALKTAYIRSPRYRNDENGRTLLPNYFQTAITRWRRRGLRHLGLYLLKRRRDSADHKLEGFITQFLKLDVNNVLQRLKQTDDTLFEEAQEIRVLMSQGHATWMDRLTWLALILWPGPSYLQEGLTCLEEEYVAELHKKGYRDHPVRVDQSHNNRPDYTI
ncbi:hypothetical protein FRB99_001677, partial [Tulasnella sp. 403]